MEGAGAMATLFIEASDDEGLGRRGPRRQGISRPEAFGARNSPISDRACFGSHFPLFVKGVGAIGQVLTGNVQIADTADKMRRYEPHQREKCA